MRTQDFSVYAFHAQDTGTLFREKKNLTVLFLLRNYFSIRFSNIGSRFSVL